MHFFSTYNVEIVCLDIQFKTLLHDTCGVVHISQVSRFGIFLKSASGLVPDGWVGLKSFGYRCHFRAFQIKLDILDTQNFGNGPVVEELQLFEVGWILGNSI